VSVVLTPIMSHAVPPPAATATFAGNVRVTTTGGGGVGVEVPPPPPPLQSAHASTAARLVAAETPRRKHDMIGS